MGMNKMKGWRTLAFNSITAVVLMGSATGFLSPEQVPGADTLNMFLNNLEVVIGGVAVVVNFVLRFFTDTAVGEKS